MKCIYIQGTLKKNLIQFYLLKGVFRSFIIEWDYEPFQYSILYYSLYILYRGMKKTFQQVKLNFNGVQLFYRRPLNLLKLAQNTNPPFSEKPCTYLPLILNNLMKMIITDPPHQLTCLVGHVCLCKKKYTQYLLFL